MGNENLTVADLAGVVYSSGKVFDGLSTGRLDTENFLRSGNLDGVTSRHDLSLLEDLRDAAQYVIDHLGARVDADFVRGLNATLTRSGSIEPGQFRRADAGIGVDTVYGRHLPPAQDQATLQTVIDTALAQAAVRDQAISLFVALAKAQPFGDGNKRTALFTANAVLLGSGERVVLTVPVDAADPGVAKEFNDRLARAYIHDENRPVEAMLREQGITPL